MLAGVKRYLSAVSPRKWNNIHQKKIIQYQWMCVYPLQLPGRPYHIDLWVHCTCVWWWLIILWAIKYNCVSNYFSIWFSICMLIKCTYFQVNLRLFYFSSHFLFSLSLSSRHHWTHPFRYNNNITFYFTYM